MATFIHQVIMTISASPDRGFKSQGMSVGLDNVTVLFLNSPQLSILHHSSSISLHLWRLLEEERPAHKESRLVSVMPGPQHVVVNDFPIITRPTVFYSLHIIPTYHVTGFPHTRTLKKDSEGERGSERDSAVQEDESPQRPACKSQLLLRSILCCRINPRTPCECLHAKKNLTHDNT